MCAALKEALILIKPRVNAHDLKENLRYHFIITSYTSHQVNDPSHRLVTEKAIQEVLDHKR